MTTKYGWWTISFDGVEPDEADLEHIGGLIQKGFTSGEIVQENEDEDDE